MTNMKSLRESLFDKDLIKKNLPTFGDVYKPIFITSTNNDQPFKQITNMFVMSKLRKAGEPLDLSKVTQNSSYDNNHIEVIELIAGIIAKLPLKSTFDYNKEIDSIFAPLCRQPYWKNGIRIDLSESSFDKTVKLEIARSNSNGYTQITILYK